MSEIPPRKITRVLVVDDSDTFTKWLQRELNEDPELQVIGIATDAYQARDLVVKLLPDVITLDLHLPRMDGVTFLEKLMQSLPTPTLVLSAFRGDKSEQVRRCLRAGAWAVVDKNAMESTAGAQAGIVELKALLKKVQSHPRRELTGPQRRAAGPGRGSGPPARDLARVIGIGASTGGVAALHEILPHLAAHMPAVVVVQHMQAGFTREFARRMDRACQMHVEEAEDGMPVQPGHILIAPGGEYHCELRRIGDGVRVRLVKGEPVMGHVPSIDVLFGSMAKQLGAKGIGCLLTGMGEDGARGLLTMRLAGAVTAGQAKEGCAVWGMPQAAHQLGACQELVMLSAIAKWLAQVAFPGEVNVASR